MSKFRRQLMMANAVPPTPPLPYDAEVQYLKGDGSAYIDTGYYANTTKTRCEMQIMPLATSTQCICGSRNTGNTSNTDNCCVFIVNGKFRFDWAKGSTGDQVNMTTGNVYTISITRGSVTVNGNTTTYSDSTSTNQTYTFLLFALHNTTAVQAPFTGRIYYAKLYDNGTLVHDYIPVRKDGVGYLYDKVSGTLFGNANSTGAFTYGNDVS